MLKIPKIPLIQSLNKQSQYLLAISGGADSVALLHLLKNSHQLILIHLNHQLRGKESGNDARFVRSLAKKLKLPCEIKKAPIAKIAKKQNISIEMTARQQRHLFFAEIAKKYKCPRILLAHHSDDNAETILWNLIRGSGGLKGISMKTQQNISGKKLTFLRPLIHTSRKEIMQFLEENQLSFRQDKTNSQPITPRNRIRNEVFPLLEKILGRNPRPAICRANEINQEKEKIVSHLLPFLVNPKETTLSVIKLKKQPLELQKVILHQWLKNQKISNISQALIHRCLKILDSTKIAKINLPKNRFLRRKSGELFLQ